MIDLYILDKNLAHIGIIDAYKSLIWAERYADIGDCELYLPATYENLSMLTMGRYIYRDNGHMVCRIEKIELQTNADSGNYLIITGKDSKALCDQRIITKTMLCNGSVETFARKMIAKTMITPTYSERIMKKANGNNLVQLGASAGLKYSTTEQVTWVNVGKKIREYCETFGIGYKFLLQSGLLTAFFYKGVDRRNTVVFSDQFENLASSDYIDDRTKMGNVSYIAGEGEGSKRTTDHYGTMTGVDRYEIYTNGSSLSRSISYADLTDAYPGGTVVDNGGAYTYRLSSLDAQIFDDDHKAWLMLNYPGGSLVTVDGIDYWRVSNVDIANVNSLSPTDSSTSVLLDIIYRANLIGAGVEDTQKYGEVITFNGTVIPDITFVLGVDYDLGDIVTVRNEYGISKAARITEIIESIDEKGYKVQPTFKYMEVA